MKYIRPFPSLNCTLHIYCSRNAYIITNLYMVITTTEAIVVQQQGDWALIF